MPTQRSALSRYPEPEGRIQVVRIVNNILDGIDLLDLPGEREYESGGRGMMGYHPFENGHARWLSGDETELVALGNPPG